MIICDSGYDSEANVVFIHENELKSLIMPKITSRYINNQMRIYDENLELLSGEKTIIDDETFRKKHEKWTYHESGTVIYAKTTDP